MENRVKSAMGGDKKSSSKKKSSSSKSKKKHGRKPSGMHIKRAANDGYVVTHDYDNEPGQESSKEEMMPHALPDHDSLMAHVDEHMGPEEQGEPGGQEPTPMPM